MLEPQQNLEPEIILAQLQSDMVDLKESVRGLTKYVTGNGDIKKGLLWAVEVLRATVEKQQETLDAVLKTLEALKANNQTGVFVAPAQRAERKILNPSTWDWNRLLFSIVERAGSMALLGVVAFFAFNWLGIFHFIQTCTANGAC